MVVLDKIECGDDGLVGITTKGTRVPLNPRGMQVGLRNKITSPIKLEEFEDNPLDYFIVGSETYVELGRGEGRQIQYSRPYVRFGKLK